MQTLHTILTKVSELENTEQKIQALLQHPKGAAIREIFKYTYAPYIEWALPDGEPPYKPCDPINMESRLISDIRRLYLFVKGGNDNLKPLRRETLFIEMLESIHPDDAKLLLAVKARKLPYKGFTKKFASKVYPELMLEGENEQIT